MILPSTIIPIPVIWKYKLKRVSMQNKELLLFNGATYPKKEADKIDRVSSNSFTHRDTSI